MAETENRRGVFGGAKPAFTVHRFKRTITINLNEEMAEELQQVLRANEKLAEAQNAKVARHLFEFNTQLQEAIDQPPPALGEKPNVLAPGRPNVVKAAS